MAHVQKFTKGSVAGMSTHIERKTVQHSNPDIDSERSYLNYDLCEKEGDMNQRLAERLNEVHCLNRADVKIMADWVVTLPERMTYLPDESQRAFFEETYAFLKSRYQQENVLTATVHNDETTPHMHFAFIPVSFDTKRQREKVSAKEILNRKELQSFHQDLDLHLKEQIPEIYKGGIINGETIGLDTIASVKKNAERVNQKNMELTAKRKKINQKIKQANDLEGKVANVYDTHKQLERLENNLSRTITGKRILRPQEMKELKTFIIGVKKGAVVDNQERNRALKQNEQLTEKLERAQRDLASSERVRQQAQTKSSELQNEREILNAWNIVLQSKLEESGTLVKDIDSIEHEGRLIVDRIENGIFPKTERQGKEWLQILEENKKKNTIEPNQLEKTINLLKEIIEKIISRIRSRSRGR